MTFKNIKRMNDFYMCVQSVAASTSISISIHRLQASVWPLHGHTCVDESVLLHVGLLVETFAAVWAGVGPGV